MSDNPQVRIWNDSVGSAWVTHAEHYDAMLEPFGEAVIGRVGIEPQHRVVDIGCGAGATTVRLARAAASVLGVDLSAPMLAMAAQRAAASGVANVELAQCDVEATAFATGAFDVAFSRFGLMFFTDPVLGFTHIRRALVDGGRLGFVCFQAPPLNPFILVPVIAAAQHLPVAPPPAATAPGPFSLADPTRITAILDAAGFTGIAIEPGPTSVTLGAAEDLHAIARRVSEQNPVVNEALAVASPSARAAAMAATAAALAEHVVDGHVVLGASTWVVTATAA